MIQLFIREGVSEGGRKGEIKGGREGYEGRKRESARESVKSTGSWRVELRRERGRKGGRMG